MRNKSSKVCLTVGLLAICVGIARADVLNMPAGQTSIDLVWVGDTNNPADPAVMTTDGTTGYGSVGYAYQMGKYEVTNAQYCQFLNAKLPTITSAETGEVLATDTYGLYNESMESEVCGGINYDPTAGTNAHFAVKSGYENRPVVLVCWYDSIRFANWLQNGQGTGSTETGTYTITGGGVNSGTVAIPNAATRASWDSVHRHWVLPSENEWYKAAYYDPHKPGGAGYWDYPTGSDTPPVNTITSPDNGNNANFYDYFNTGTHTLTTTSPYVTTVGEFENSDSPYGTFDQCGNVSEWNEALIGSSPGLRGGAWNQDSRSLPASYRSSLNYEPTFETRTVGFRVAYVPEPGSITLLVAGGCCLLLARVWRRRKTTA